MNNEFETISKVKSKASTALSKFTSDLGQINDELNEEAAANYHKSNDWTEQDAEDYKIALDKQMHIAGVVGKIFLGFTALMLGIFILTEIGVF